MKRERDILQKKSFVFEDGHLQSLTKEYFFLQ